jgi:hypothetical protein
MAMKANWVTVTSEQQAELSQRLPASGWRIIPSRDLPSVFPPSFREKIDSAFVITAPTSTGGTYLAYSANRVDFKSQAIDVEPLGLIVHSTGANSSACFLHHGDWEGRSQPPPAGFWEDVDRSGVGEWFKANPPTGLSSGTIDQLPKGHRGAFESLVREIRARVDGHRTSK